MNYYFKRGLLLCTLFLYANLLNNLSVANTSIVETKNYYNEILIYIKNHENPNFRVSKIHDDGNGYPTIGYGHLIQDHEQFENYITIEQADSLLRIDYEIQIRYVKANFKGLKENQIHAIAHMSFCIGIGNIIKNKMIYKSKWGTWRIDHKTVLSFCYIGNTKRNDLLNLRKYEINLWAGKQVYKIKE